jgi:hypothetical protein
VLHGEDLEYVAAPATQLSREYRVQLEVIWGIALASVDVPAARIEVEVTPASLDEGLTTRWGVELPVCLYPVTWPTWRVKELANIL